MVRITVEITNETHRYLVGQKGQRGSSISFEANQLIEAQIKERNRKKKGNAEKDHSEHNSTD